MYTDACDDLAGHAQALLMLADKYMVRRLKSLCEESLGERLEVSNAAEMLVRAYLHEAKSLQADAVDFVTSNMVKVMETPGWKTVTESHPRIVNDILRSLAARRRK